MIIICSQILAGFLLSWVELAWMRRQVRQLFGNPTQGKHWVPFFGVRWIALVFALAALSDWFKPNFFIFLASFIVWNFILRIWYGRKAYA